MQSLKKKTEGFTIIEVMIVLVIAAVIILIVFLAVPALQRNSRNNQRKNDAARILAATGEWRSNNNNAMPSTAAHATEIQTNAGTLAYFSGVGIDGKGTVGYEDLTNNGTVSTWASTSQVNIVTGARCENTSTKRSGNGVIAVYQIETGNGTAWICTG